GDIIIAYADSIDTAAWLVLLIMLELETYVIPDEKIKGWVDRTISIVSFVCWALILYSLYGYIGSLDEAYGYAAYAGADPCGLVDTGATLARGLDDYVDLDAENCRASADPCGLVDTGATLARGLDDYVDLDAENCRALAGGALVHPA